MNNYEIILASKSPRRQDLMKKLDVNFKIKVLENIPENYPINIKVDDIAVYLAKQKAEYYKKILLERQLLITADTLVILNDEPLGKPESEGQAIQMLHSLSGKTHHVITGVCLTSTEKQTSFSTSTQVTFKKLSEEEINYYVSKYKPFDKAGAYGIQEWIGCVGITSINGSFYNVMGLPVQRIYEELIHF